MRVPLHKMYKFKIFLTFTTWKLTYTTVKCLMLNSTFLVIDNLIIHTLRTPTVQYCFTATILLRFQLCMVNWHPEGLSIVCIGVSTPLPPSQIPLPHFCQGPCLTPIKSANCPKTSPTFLGNSSLYCFFMPPHKNPIFCEPP